jgi:hypothetical protein
MDGMLLFWLIQVFVLLLGVSIGHSVLLLKIRHEENRKRELELALLEKRSDILQQGKKIAHDLEEVLIRQRYNRRLMTLSRKMNLVNCPGFCC